MARQSILFWGSLCGGGLALGLLARQLSQSEQVISPPTRQISVAVVSDERPWPPIPTPPPPLPSPQPRPSGSLPIPVPIPRTEGVSRFENGRIANPALYQATVDAWLDLLQDSGHNLESQSIVVALPDGTQLASFQPHQYFSSSVVSWLVTSQAAHQTRGSRLEPLSLVASPASLMGILQSLAVEGQLSPRLPAQTSSLPQMMMAEGSAQSLSVGEGESYVMAGQLPDGTLFVLANRGSSVDQVQHLQHRLLVNLATLRQ
ncbi:MAG: hypothetical protein HC924_15585 [Synechococcaceae cyanobacterium SM2_3_2]|nr:hypothetical protein [Synechococcaceae cyanobacterium SM2_3_2]